MALLRKGIRSCDMLCSIFSDFLWGLVLSFKNADVLGWAFLYSFLPSPRFMKGILTGRDRSCNDWWISGMRFYIVNTSCQLICLQQRREKEAKASLEIEFKVRIHFHKILKFASSRKLPFMLFRTCVILILKILLVRKWIFFFHGISAHTKPVPLDYFFVSHSMYQPHHSTL